MLYEHQHENSRSKNNILNRSENLKRSTFYLFLRNLLRTLLMNKSIARAYIRQSLFKCDNIEGLFSFWNWLDKLCKNERNITPGLKVTHVTFLGVTLSSAFSSTSAYLVNNALTVTQITCFVSLNTCDNELITNLALNCCILYYYWFLP